MKLSNLIKQKTIDLTLGHTKEGAYEKIFLPAIEQFSQQLIVSSGLSVIYVISDVPRISQAKFQKLKDLSFGTYRNPRIQSHVLGMSIFNTRNMFNVRRKDDKRFRQAYKDGHINRIAIMKWKKFVTLMTAKYPPEHYDDFDE